MVIQKNLYTKPWENPGKSISRLKNRCNSSKEEMKINGQNNDTCPGFENTPRATCAVITVHIRRRGDGIGKR
jgi:hypothetical protein